jgi:endonuclease/exonuclease/phosphatase family metal-dependent hydrolase
MRILTWNLFHGRTLPEQPRSLEREFTHIISSWDWDVALLQEVPPWWPVPLGRASGASVRMARTSRNWLLPVRRWAAERRPDLMKSNGGGANAILVRGMPIEEHRVAILRRRPEQRVVHGVRLGGSGMWVANTHAQVRPHGETRKDLARAGAIVLRWAGDAPVILGGDVNVHDPRIEGFTDLGGFHVDHILARGLRASGPPRKLDRRGLSDHPPVVVDVQPPGRTEDVTAS